MVVAQINSTDYSIVLIAGEESGDIHGSMLMKELKKRLDSVSFYGQGGTRMSEEADEAGGCVENWINKSAVIGLVDVLFSYFYFKKKLNQILSWIQQRKPIAIILIDYPGFNLRLAHEIRKKKLPIKIIYYISPQIWAWKFRRIHQIIRTIDIMLVIFPFELDIYQRYPIKTIFVGHPIATLQPVPLKSRDKNLLALLPGSRKSEILYLFPRMLQTVHLLKKNGLNVIVEVAISDAKHKKIILELSKIFNISVNICEKNSHDLMKRATFGIICSGTATLEAACLGLPHILVYRTSWLTYWIGHLFIRIPYLGIINILAGSTTVEEFIQLKTSPKILAQTTIEFFRDTQKRLKLVEKFAKIIDCLAGCQKNKNPYEQASDAICDLITSKP